MKKIYFILCFQIALLATGYAQAIPKGMNYQAVARNLRGEIISNQKVSLKINLFGNENLQRSNHYSEIHEVTTNEFGLFNLVIGEGSKEQGEYGLVPWNSENIWLEVAIKDKGQSGFAMVSSSKLQAVPYAIHAGTANALSKKTETKTSSFAPPEPGVVSDSWSVFGNAQTDASGNPYRVNSLGTTDFVDLIMITDNIERLRILSTGDIITKLNFEVGKDLTIGENLFVVQTTMIGDSLEVKKNVLFNTTGGGTINYGPFTVSNASPTLLKGKLTVDQATDLNATLNVDGNTDINARLFVNNMSPVHLSGTLQVDSTTNLNDALTVTNMSPTVFSGTLLVDSCATFNDKVLITSQFSTDTSGLFPSGSLQVGGGAYIKENLYVGGVAKFGGPVAFAGAVSIQDVTQSTSTTTGALKVFGGVGIGLNLNVGGAARFGLMTTIKDTTESVDTLSGALKVRGGVGIGLNLNVGGAVFIGNALSVTGTTTLNNTLNVISGGYFAAHFTNTTNNHGISIQINTAAPGWANNYIEFRRVGGGVVGRIEGENQSEFTSNPNYIRQVALLNSNITFSEIAVATATIYLASAIAGVVAAATSFTPCAGLGFCVTSPLISFIVKAALEVAARGVGLGLAVAQLIKNKDRKNDYINYKASHVGVTYESGAGDYAEWLPKNDPEESFLPGYIVGLKNGKISKNTDETGKLMVISSKPIILGNTPVKGKEKTYEKVAFMGQVPVHVLGKVNIGDYILPSGNNDGLGRAVTATEMKAEDYTNMVGVAWSSSENDSYNEINVAIGLNDADINKVVVEQKEMIQSLKTKFSQSNVLLAKLVPGYQELVRINNSEGIEQPLKAGSHIDYAGKLTDMNFTSSKGNFSEISNEQVDEMMSLAEKTYLEKGGSIEGNPFWSQLKTEPGFKTEFYKNIQNVYKKEFNNQVEKFKPRQ